VRNDIRSSFGAYTGTAAGIPLTLRLKLVNVNSFCSPLAGRAIYVWHCAIDGLYSLYTAPNQNYLRGVQETDSAGTVSFQSIFPGCYPGRYPHIHFEIFPSLAVAMSYKGTVKTSQLALPAGACNQAYATKPYAASAQSFAQVSLDRDLSFSDGSSLQVATVTGNASAGFVLR
jgi:protocatechuate 3,4-dioxygenase beta subunit